MNPRWTLSPRRAVLLVVMVGAWCALWGSISYANVFSGLLLAVGVLASGVGTSGVGTVRVLPLIALAWLVLRDLIESTWSVAREVLTPTDYTEEGVIEVVLPEESRRHLLLLSVAVTVTPGTAVVDADPDTGTLYLHVLHVDRRGEVEEHVRQLARLACRALPVSTQAGPEVPAP